MSALSSVLLTGNKARGGVSVSFADYILKGNAIFDSISDEPFAGFVAVKKNRILSVGRDSESYENLAGRDTEVINLGDKMIMPGMIDAHMHFFDGIFQNSRFMCRDLFPCKSAKECVDVIAGFAKEHPDYETITGMGWFIPLWEDTTPPHKNMLDEIESERPVYLMCADGHSFWLNSKAMEECQINPDRELLFGEIEKDENGEANGVMHELDACAICTVFAQKLPAYEREKLIEEFVQILAKAGITSTTDMAVVPEPPEITDELKVMADMERAGRLNLRLNLYPALGTKDDFEIAKEYRKNFHSNKLRVAGLKAFVDGVHGNHTALLTKPYADEPDKIGESFYPHEYYIKQISSANKEGFGVKLHCCGEGAVKWALDAYENSTKQGNSKGIRNSIEHVETYREEDLKRFTDNNVTATMQPLHLMYEGDILQSILGLERAQHQYAVKDMLESGVNVAFSSDYPVAEFNPMVNIYFAVTRCDKDGKCVEKNSTQAITVAQALKAYTYGSAYCINMEDKLGTLEKGKLADIIVLDKNLMKATPEEILNTRVELTMVDGIISYKNL